MTTTTTHTNNQHPVAPDQPTRIFAQWGLPHTVTPRFGARLIQSHYRLDFLPDRASLIGEWSQMQIAKLDLAFPEVIKALESKLLTGTCPVPQIVLDGRRGGSALAVTTLHAILENLPAS